MNKFKKIICCAIMPILAMVGLAGCGNDRDALTIQSRYTDMIQSNQDMFVKEKDAQGNETGVFSVKVGVTYNSSEMEKLATIQYDNFKTDVNLYARYVALKDLQAVVLDNVFEYYKQQKDKFFTNFDAQEMDKKERKQLYNSIEDLEEAIEEFKVARDKFDNAVDILTFEGIVRADITSYAYDYNMLIEKCIEFVRCFKELNLKYYYSSEVKDINYQEYIKQYLDEAVFELNEVAYYNYIKSFNSVAECDLCKAYDIDAVQETLKYSTNWIANINELKGKASNFNADNYIYGKITLDQISKFQEERDMFLQKFGVYKTVFEKMDYYKYNQKVVSGESSTYKTEVTNVEMANINLVEKFYTEVGGYYTAIITLVG